MAGLRELLLRFRPSGAPGSATIAAVPADRAAEREAEPSPVFADLAASETQAADIRARAAAEAQRTRHDAARQAEQIMAEAREGAVREREGATRRARTESEAYCAQIPSDARAGAESRQTRAQISVPEYTERFVADLAAQLCSRPESGSEAAR
jgi:cell division septum initiation protein DivIVA